MEKGTRVTAEWLVENEVSVVGSADQIVEQLMRTKEYCGYDDFMMIAWFEKGGIPGEEVEEFMQYFAEEVSPALRDACGGAPKRKVDDVPRFDDVRAQA